MTNSIDTTLGENYSVYNNGHPVQVDGWSHDIHNENLVLITVNLKPDPQQPPIPDALKTLLPEPG